jgi:hypothetical protein
LCIAFVLLATEVVVRMGTVVRAATRPNSMVVGMLADATRTRGELIAENALLRQQLIVAARASRVVGG